MTPLRQRLIDELTRRNYSPRTTTTYVDAVARTARHFNRSPDRLTTDQLRDFQLHLITQSVSWCQFNQITCALRFFYRHVLDRPEFVPFVVFAKKPHTLPVVLSPQQVRQLLDTVPAGRNRLMFRIAYGCGLRVSELTHLRVADIDGARHLLWVRAGKGNKDRGVPLPQVLLDELRQYWQAHRPADWMFPGPTAQPLNISTLQRAFQAARRTCRLPERVTIHTLRHCYATHLLESGVDVPTLQRLLGHNCSSTTMRYLHLRADRLPNIRSPLDVPVEPATSGRNGTNHGGTGRCDPSGPPGRTHTAPHLGPTSGRA